MNKYAPRNFPPTLIHTRFLLILFVIHFFYNRDMESVDALIRGIQGFQGGVVLVSHDARLIASTGCELWVCEGKGTVRRGSSVFSKCQTLVMNGCYSFCKLVEATFHMRSVPVPLLSNRANSCNMCIYIHYLSSGKSPRPRVRALPPIAPERHCCRRG